MSFTLPELPYSFDALEPYIDAKTMEIHHDKHHAAYTNNLNGALENTDLSGLTIEEILVKGFDIPAIRNNGGGYYNHNLFWEILSPKGGGAPQGPISEAINTSFGSFEAFKEEFTKAATTRFGSGWTWLVSNEGELSIGSTANQDNPIMPSVGIAGKPLLALDVWEHAYYLNYQNRRPDYINAFFNIINWDKVNQLFKG